jgi:integrase
MTTKYVPVKGHRGITKYQNADGKDVYRVQVYQGRDWQTGKRRYASQQPFTSLKAAVAWQAEQKDRVRRGEVFTPSMTPLGQVCDDWLDSLASVSPKTRAGYRHQLAWITAEIGDVPLSRVTPAMLERVYADHLRAGHKASTIRGVHTTIKRVFQRAVDHEQIRTNPAARVRPPSETPDPPVTWTHAQMRYFLDVSADDPYWGVVWRFMAETWVRVGELAALTWDALDVEARTVTISRTMTVDDGGARTVADKGKTPAARRVIPITAELVGLLRYHRDGLRFMGRNATDTGLVFPAPQSGSWLGQTTVAYALRQACRRAGVPVLKPHEVRHTGGSIAYRAGVDPKVISERLGHSTPEFSMRVYLHSDEDLHRQVAERIGELLSG